VAGAAFAIGSTFPYYHQRWLGTGTTRNTEQFSIQTPSAGAAAIFVPGTTNTNALGSSSLRFSNVYTTALNTSGPITAGAGQAVIVSTSPRGALAVASLYSSYTIPAGTVFFNSTSNVLCVSSGTAQTSITVSTGTGACPN
jgi:hypothetical protein